MVSMRTFSLRPAPVRLLIGLILAAGIAFLSFQLIRNAVGSSIMTFLQRSADLAPDSRLEGAQLAARWAPDDPTVRYGAGGIYLTAALTEQSETRLSEALNELQVASRLVLLPIIPIYSASERSACRNTVKS